MSAVARAAAAAGFSGCKNRIYHHKFKLDARNNGSTKKEETPWFPEYYIGWIGIGNCDQETSSKHGIKSPI